MVDGCAVGEKSHDECAPEHQRSRSDRETRARVHSGSSGQLDDEVVGPQRENRGVAFEDGFAVRAHMAKRLAQVLRVYGEYDPMPVQHDRPILALNERRTERIKRREDTKTR